MMVVLFACVHKAAAEQARARAISAGTQPGVAVHPEVLVIMRDVGLNLDGVRPTMLTQSLAEAASLLVTMGCGEARPVVPGLAREDWPLDDPKGKTVDEVRRIREAIRLRVDTLITREGWGHPHSGVRDGHQSSQSARRALDLAYVSAEHQVRLKTPPVLDGYAETEPSQKRQAQVQSCPPSDVVTLVRTYPAR